MEMFKGSKPQKDKSKCTVLHVLIDTNPLYVFNSVYCAIYLWHRAGFDNHIATEGLCTEFSLIISQIYHLHGTLTDKARQLAAIRGTFDIVIVYEPKDVEAFALSRMFFPRYRYRHLIHHSLEIPTFTYEKPTLKNRLHLLVMALGMRKVERLVIQDTFRRELLIKIFPSLASKESFLVPNSFISEIEPMADSLLWFDEIRSRARCLVLYIGSIARWALSEELLTELMKIEGVDFVFSGWSRDGYDKLLRELCRDCSNINFHLGVKSRADLNYMVAHADIGLAFYDQKDENVKTMGLSSGKIFRYLAYGKPVIINEMQFTSDYIRERGFGVATDLGAIGDAITGIIENYSHYQTAIITGYNSDSRYEDCYSPLVEKLTGVTRR
jgi:glycosyltransferase involved in cell wall biosynthesis